MKKTKVKSHCVVPENVHIPPWKVIGNRWVLKVKLFEEKYEAKLDILGGGGGEGAEQKTLDVGGA